MIQVVPRWMDRYCQQSNLLSNDTGGPQVDGPLLSTILRKRVRLEGTLLRSRSNQVGTLPSILTTFSSLYAVEVEDIYLKNTGEHYIFMWYNYLNSDSFIYFSIRPI